MKALSASHLIITWAASGQQPNPRFAAANTHFCHVHDAALRPIQQGSSYKCLWMGLFVCMFYYTLVAVCM
jgi:hypothetical protein